MTTIKATIVEDAVNYSVQFEDGTCKHEQPKEEISVNKYIKLMLKNYPHYDFFKTDEVIEEPKEEVLEIDDKFNPAKQDIQTGEVLEPEKKVDHPQPEFINPLKTNTMENKKEPEAQPKVETPTVEKVAITRRMRRGAAKTTEFGIKGVTLVAVTGCFVIGDIFAGIGNLCANVGATAIKPLGLHPDATRAEIAEDLKNTSNTALTTVYLLPKNMAAKALLARAVAKQAIVSQAQTVTA